LLCGVFSCIDALPITLALGGIQGKQGQVEDKTVICRLHKNSMRSLKTLDIECGSVGFFLLMTYSLSVPTRVFQQGRTGTAGMDFLSNGTIETQYPVG
jgi:hypothetical protein